MESFLPAFLSLSLGFGPDSTPGLANVSLSVLLGFSPVSVLGWALESTFEFADGLCEAGG